MGRAVERLSKTLVAEAGAALAGVTEVVLLDFPAHGNRGDSAIFTGELALLVKLGIKLRLDLVCAAFVPVAAAPACDFTKLRAAFPPRPHRAVLLHGGGNVGREYPRPRRSLFRRGEKSRFDRRPPRNIRARGRGVVAAAE